MRLEHRCAAREREIHLWIFWAWQGQGVEESISLREQQLQRSVLVDIVNCLSKHPGSRPLQTVNKQGTEERTLVFTGLTPLCSKLRMKPIPFLSPALCPTLEYLDSLSFNFLVSNCLNRINPIMFFLDAYPCN